MKISGPLALGILAAALVSLAAPVAQAGSYGDDDPWMGFNRAMFRFNDVLDEYAFEPVARGWNFVVPRRVQTSLSNLFGNLTSPRIIVNDLLQGKLHDAASDTARFMVNSTFGLMGLFDVASAWKLDRHDEDFGQTLGVWGVPPGPYVVLPLFGPSNPRDATGLAVDSSSSVYWYFIDLQYNVAARAVDIVNGRAAVLKQVRDVKEASVDYYAAVRNGYMQRRQAQVEDRSELSESQQEDLYTIEE
jgi:phospholipid-binding lipoprotein MlaA